MLFPFFSEPVRYPRVGVEFKLVSTTVGWIEGLVWDPID
jgi:hypothetical protein